MNTNEYTSLAPAASFPESAFSWDDCVGSAVATELGASIFFADHGWEFPYVIVVATELPEHEVHFSLMRVEDNAGIYDSDDVGAEYYEHLSLRIINDSCTAVA